MENPESSRKELYWQSRLGQIERRVEKLEAEFRALQMDPSNGSDFYSIKEAATALKLSRLTIQRRIERGQIKAYKVGRNWRIPKSEILSVFDA